MREWDGGKPVCGNCKYWALQGYQHDWEGAEPLGIGGTGADGSVSDCRANAPISLLPGDARLHGSAQWPTTKRKDWCGQFEQRTR